MCVTETQVHNVLPLVDEFERPTCETCDLPMWLVQIERVTVYQADRLHFECKVCDSRAVLPAL